MAAQHVPDRRSIQPDGAFDASRYGFSQGVAVDGVLYVSGQVSTAADLASKVGEAWASDVEVDEAAWTHLQPLIEAATAPHLPAATMVKVVGLANPALLVEIEAIAHLPRTAS